MVYRMGYKCPWEKYPAVDFIDFDFKEVRLDADKVEGALAMRRSVDAFESGLPLDAAHVPEKLLWTSRKDPLDYITLYGSSVISPRMKDIIEQFEPDVHQFFPLQVMNKKKEPIAEHYLWVVCNRIDSVDREHTTLELHKGVLWMPERLEGDSWVRLESPKLVFSNRQAQGYHFWRDKYLLPSSGIICSDEAGQELKAADLIGLGVGPAETV
jgi:hypothetical protein